MNDDKKVDSADLGLVLRDMANGDAATGLGAGLRVSADYKAYLRGRAGAVS